MFDVIHYKTNFNTLSLKKLNENNKFVFNNVVTNNRFKNSKILHNLIISLRIILFVLFLLIKSFKWKVT